MSKIIIKHLCFVWNEKQKPKTTTIDCNSSADNSCLHIFIRLVICSVIVWIELTYSLLDVIESKFKSFSVVDGTRSLEMVVDCNFLFQLMYFFNIINWLFASLSPAFWPYLKCNLFWEPLCLLNQKQHKTTLRLLE